MEKAYAEALWGMIVAGKDPKTAVATLHASLERRGRIGLMPKIAREFREVAERAQARAQVTLTVAHEKDVHWALQDARSYLDQFGIAKDNVTTRVDETLIGGWRLEGRERFVDASYKHELLALYERITNKA